jgi:hypothetical protein
MRAQITHNALPIKVKFFAFREVDFKKQIEVCDRLADQPSGHPKRSATKQRLAATEAYHLLRYYDRSVNTTRGGKWCDLSAILYGDPLADLFHYCCQLAKLHRSLEDRNRV